MGGGCSPRASRGVGPAPFGPLSGASPRRSMAFLADELATIEGLVGNAPDRRPDIEKALDLLDSHEAGVAFR